MSCNFTSTGFVGSVRIAFASKLRGAGFKERYNGWPGQYNNVECSTRLKKSFELNPAVTEGKQRAFLFLCLECTCHVFHIDVTEQLRTYSELSNLLCIYL